MYKLRVLEAARAGHGLYPEYLIRGEYRPGSDRSQIESELGLQTRAYGCS